MKQVMGLLTARFIQIGGIDFLDGRVVVGLAVNSFLVVCIEGIGTLCADVFKGADFCKLLGLAAAVDAAAGACHYFDKVI